MSLYRDLRSVLGHQWRVRPNLDPSYPPPILRITRFLSLLIADIKEMRK